MAKKQIKFHLSTFKNENFNTSIDITTLTLFTTINGAQYPHARNTIFSRILSHILTKQG